MIKYTRQGNGLKEYSKRVTFIDTDQYSKNFFRVLDFPDRLYVGKNSFRISGNPDNLVKGSKIYIDIVDANGNIIYHEILNVVNKDQSRTVVAYVYTDTPTGDATIYIAGRVGADPRTGMAIGYSNSPSDPDYKDVPNIMWIGKSAVVSNKQNNTEVFFTKEPKVYFSETLAEFKDINDSSRSTTLTYQQSASYMSMKSRPMPKQFSGGSVFNDEYVDGSERLKRIPIVDSENKLVESQESKQLPEYTALTTIESSNNIFNRSMVGGSIRVTNISVDAIAPKDSVSILGVNDYSASIVKVISPTIAQVDRPFIQTYRYKSTDGTQKDIVLNTFVNQPSWSIDYYDNNKQLIGLKTSESFVNLEFVDLEPAAGTVDRVNISYKPVGTIGDFTDLGDYRIKTQNILIDPIAYNLTLDQGLVNKEIGFPESSAEVSLYWTANAHATASILNFKFDDVMISNGIRCDWVNAQENAYVTIKPSDSYSIMSAKNTEYKLKFSTAFISNSDWASPFLDVYISGSTTVSDIIPQRYSPNPIKNPELGTYIGTVTSKKGILQESEMFFITKERKPIKPIFVLRSGDVRIGQISIQPRKEIGFSPNHAKFKIPLSQLTKSAELIFNFQYLNSDGAEANLNTTVYGLIFTGSDGAEPLPSGIISSSKLDIHEFVSTSSPSKTQLSISDGGEMVLYGATQSFMSSPMYYTTYNPQVGRHEVSFNGYAGVWTSAGTSTQISASIFERMGEVGTHYTASKDVAVGIYDIDMMIYATSGSYITPKDKYIWGRRLRGRYLFPYRNSLVPIFYDAAVSNTSFVDDGFSTFGKPSAEIINSWEDAISISATHSAVENDNGLYFQLDMKGSILPAGRMYDVYYVGTCKVWKLEYEVIIG